MLPLKFITQVQNQIRVCSRRYFWTLSVDRNHVTYYPCGGWFYYPLSVYFNLLFLHLIHYVAQPFPYSPHLSFSDQIECCKKVGENLLHCFGDQSLKISLFICTWSVSIVFVCALNLWLVLNFDSRDHLQLSKEEDYFVCTKFS